MQGHVYLCFYNDDADHGDKIVAYTNYVCIVLYQTDGKECE